MPLALEGAPVFLTHGASSALTRVACTHAYYRHRWLQDTERSSLGSDRDERTTQCMCPTNLIKNGTSGNSCVEALSGPTAAKLQRGQLIPLKLTVFFLY